MLFLSPFRALFSAAHFCVDDILIFSLSFLLLLAATLLLRHHQSSCSYHPSIDRTRISRSSLLHLYSLRISRRPPAGSFLGPCSHTLDTMSENAESSPLESLLNSMNEKLQDLPPSTLSAPEDPPAPTRYRLFNRQRPMHQVLGGGKSADILLWRRKFLSVGVLVGTTIAWFLFEHSGYTLLTVVANVLLVLIVALFVWSHAAVFLNRPPPPLPELELSEDMVASFASALREEINKALAVAHDIALGKDGKLFLKVVAVLWGLSVVGGWFHFLTLVYICVLIAHTVPAIYDRYEDHIDSYAKIAVDEGQKHYRKIDAAVFSKISRGATKEKKSQ